MDPLVLRGVRSPEHPVLPDRAPGVPITHVTNVGGVLRVTSGVIRSSHLCRPVKCPDLVPNLKPGSVSLKISPDLAKAACDGRRGAELCVKVDISAAILKHESVNCGLSDLVINGVLEPVIVTLRLKCEACD